MARPEVRIAPFAQVSVQFGGQRAAGLKQQTGDVGHGRILANDPCLVNDIDHLCRSHRQIEPPGSLDRMEIREATTAEHAEAGRVTAAAYRSLVRDPSYLERIADVADRAQRTIVLVAVEDGAIVGSLTLEVSRRVNARDDPLEAHRAHIRMLGVAPGHQGRGIGTALMREAEARALAAGKTEITLHTTEPMTAARAVYAGLGYERGADEVLPDGLVLLGYRRVLGADSD